MSIESVEKVVPKLGYWKIRGVSSMNMRLFFCKMQSFQRAPVPGFPACPAHPFGPEVHGDGV